MGCCVSTVDTSNSKPHPLPHALQSHPRSKALPQVELESRSPPAAEEESVKEVLSETPISKSHSPQTKTQQQIPSTNNITQSPQHHHSFQPHFSQHLFPTPQPPLSPQHTKNDDVPVSVSVSVSDLSHPSETFSTTTTLTIGDKREDEVTSKRTAREVTNQRPMWSPSSKRPYTVDNDGVRERRSKSPARRAQPSPEKRNPRGESGVMSSRKPNVGPAGVRRDAGEKSRRRSRSPSTRLNQSRVNGGCRSQVKPPGGGVRRLPEPPCKAVENESMGSENIEEGNDAVPRESIENPHVSMECFIFL